MQFLSTPTDTIAVIDGVLPSAGEWALIARDRVLVNVLSMPGRAESLDDLVPFGGYISRLSVNSATCTDLTAVERLPHLKWLLVGGVVTQHPNPEKLTSLEYFAGDPTLFPGIVSLPTISRLKIRWRDSVMDEVSASTSELTLTEASRLAHLGGIERLRSLSSLTIHGSRHISLGGLGSLTSLRSLTLHSVKRIEDTSAVLDAPQLSRFTLEDCREIDQPECLLAFTGEVVVIGRNPFTAEFKRAAGSAWTFPRGTP